MKDSLLAQAKYIEKIQREKLPTSKEICDLELIGFFTGIYPARRAARINALDVLRYE